jgi:hypothetical protein
MTVAPFTKTLGTLDNRPIVSVVAIAYHDHKTDKTDKTDKVILVAIHQAILTIEELDKNLLCPMQM